MIQILIDELEKFYPETYVSVSFQIYKYDSGRKEVEWKLFIGYEHKDFPTWAALHTYAKGLMKDVNKELTDSTIVLMSEMSEKEQG